MRTITKWGGMSGGWDKGLQVWPTRGGHDWRVLDCQPPPSVSWPHTAGQSSCVFFPYNKVSLLWYHSAVDSRAWFATYLGLGAHLSTRAG